MDKVIQQSLHMNSYTVISEKIGHSKEITAIRI